MMTNEIILKVSNRVYKVIDNQDSLETAKYFLPASCDMDLEQFFSIL